MLPRPRVLAAGALALLVILLSGCAGTTARSTSEDESRVEASPTVTAQELNARSTELLQLVDQILQTSGTAPVIELDGAHPALTAPGRAAVTITSLDGAQPARIVLDPAALATATQLQVRALLAHELVHVRLQPTTSPSTPLWAVEGFADLVAFHLVDAPGQPLLDAATATGPVIGLPSDSDFDQAGAEQSAAYAQAWTFWKMLADQSSLTGARQIYHELSLDGDSAAFDAAVQQVIGTSSDELVAQWLNHLQESA